MTRSSDDSPRWSCIHCGSRLQPLRINKISTGGWVVFWLLSPLLLVCIPVCFLGFLMRDACLACQQCGVRTPTL